ncbi:MAG: hypothetical protein ACRCZI_02500 [Cetobacterium sp.]
MAGIVGVLAGVAVFAGEAAFFLAGVAVLAGKAATALNFLAGFLAFFLVRGFLAGFFICEELIFEWWFIKFNTLNCFVFTFGITTRD